MTTLERKVHGFTMDFGGWDEPDVISARLFGRMVKLATTTITEYHSDLYRDAQLLHELMPDIIAEARERGAADFFWAARTHGTILTRYRGEYAETKGILSRVFGYRIIIRHRYFNYFEADWIPDTEPYVALPLTRGGEH